MSITLTRSPIPLGDTEEDIRGDPIMCYVCWNLYGGSMNTASFSPVVSMHSYSGTLNAARAAATKDVGRKPTWAGPGTARADYASWAVSVPVAEIPASATAGCASCRLLQVAIEKLGAGSVDFSDRLLRLGMTVCQDNVLRLDLQRDNVTIDVDYDVFGTDVFGNDTPDDGVSTESVASWELFTSPELPCPWPTVGYYMNIESPGSDERLVGGYAKRVSSDPTDDAAFDQIKTWMSTCKGQHSICRKVDTVVKRHLPKRALYIGSVSSDKISLVEEGDTMHHRSDPYIALSHCWGKTQHLTSTKDTLRTRKKGISLQSMSRTFQDAILIARKLDIYYVWIDSLCIVQDDAKDWETEAAKMASIYNGAYLVVAATAMPDGSGGCLFTRKPEISIDGTSPDGTPFHVYGRDAIDHKIFGWGVDQNWQRVCDPINTTGRLERDRSAYPLMSRAWCFQERMLATRMLHYTKHEVVFECASCMNCECGALEDYESDPHLDARRVILTKGDSAVGKPAVARNRDIENHDTWREFMMEFAQKQITKRTDCLPAIAGLAVKWHDLTSTGRYLAGIWELDTLRSLAWIAHEADDGKEMSYIAPSWSWLSVQRGVTWGGNQLRDRQYFVDIHYDRTACHPLHQVNPFGQVSCGYIFMTGRIMPVKIGRFYESASSVDLVKDGHAESAYFRLPDSMARLRQCQNEQLFCLRYCNFGIGRPMATEEDSALVLAKAKPQDLDRQPNHVREFGHVYVRLGITTHYLTDVWKHDTESSEVQLYLV